MKNSTPKGLSRAARQWFSRLVKDFSIDDTAGYLLLEQAMRAFDRAERARELVDREGEVLSDRWGQRKPHPAAAIERDARAAMLQALKALNLDIEPLRDGPGRPPGR